MKSLLEYIDKKYIDDSRDVPTIEDRAVSAISLGSSLAYPLIRSESDLPVEAYESKWKVLDDPERLVRSFKFKKFKSLKYFLDQLLSFQEKINHHANITIDHRNIVISTYTKDLREVTELDKKLAAYADEIYDDVSYFAEYGSYNER